MSQWLILRTAGRHTLRLAKTLAEDGYDVWTPTETVRLRARRGYKAQENTAPIMPGYVFAKADQYLSILELIHKPSLNYRVWDNEKKRMVSKGHPYFRVFMPFSRIEIVSEAALSNLRRLERLTLPKGPLREWNTGDRVALKDGAYAGLYGTVEKFCGERTTVAIDGWDLRPTISTRLLHPEVDEDIENSVRVASSTQAPIAKAA